MYISTPGAEPRRPKKDKGCRVFPCLFLTTAAFPWLATGPWFLFFMLFNMGAFLSVSGKIRKGSLLPRMYTCPSCATRPSLYVTVVLDIWQFMLSTASMSFPWYTSLAFVSLGAVWPSASCRTLISIPMDTEAGRELGSSLLFLSSVVVVAATQMTVRTLGWCPYKKGKLDT